jgi:YD repeat-containing protein
VILFSNTFDNSNRVITQRDSIAANAPRTWIYTNNSDGTSSTVFTDRAGKKSTYKFDKNLQLTEIDDANGESDKWVLDASGNQLSHTNKNGHTTRSTYDGNGNRLTSIDSTGQMTTMAYDAHNRLKLNERILVEARSPFVRPFDHVIPGDGRDYVFRFGLEDVGTIKVIVAQQLDCSSRQSEKQQTKKSPTHRSR